MHKRLSVKLDDTQIKYLMETQDITASKAINQAIATEYYLLNEISSGSKVLIQRADGTIVEVVFR